MVTEVDLSWDPEAFASGYDIVKGDLIDLHATMGDFAATTTACTVDDTPGPPFPDAEMPVVGQGNWFVVRSVNCGGNGTYDTASPFQIGSRDVEINASPFSCS